MIYNDMFQPNNQPSNPLYPPVPGSMASRPTPTTQEVEAVQPPYMPPREPYYAPVPPQKPGRSGARVIATVALTFMIALVFAVGLFSGWEFAHTTGGSTTSSSVSSGSTSAPSSGSNANSLETQREAAIAAVEPSVVVINVTTPDSQVLGSGVIIDNKGDIVTNNHVVSGETSITVTLYNDKTETAQVLGTDANNDLAVIHIQPFANMKVATLGDSSQLTIGEDVIAIGNPLGYTETATNGVVSALNRDEAESNSVTLNNLIQTDAAINPGNSGGALITLQGQVVGIPTLGADDTETHTPANGIGFAISSNQVKTVIAQILQQAGS